MKLSDPSLCIPPQIWAVIYALQEDRTIPDIDEDFLWVSTRQFKANCAEGFILSYKYTPGQYLNLSITEHGSADTICVMVWVSDTRPLDVTHRPDNARFVQFQYLEVKKTADYVLALVGAFCSGKNPASVTPVGALSIE